jgi:predicted  nucleic acid-binding Zn-ribbon protein
MPDITLKAIADVVRIELEPVKAELTNIRQIVDSHTATLDAIVKNTATWEVEVKVIRNQMEKQEKVIKLLAQKLNLDVEALLN